MIVVVVVVVVVVVYSMWEMDHSVQTNCSVETNCTAYVTYKDNNNIRKKAQRTEWLQGIGAVAVKKSNIQD